MKKEGNRLSMTINEAQTILMYAKAGAEPREAQFTDDPITPQWVAFLIRAHNKDAPLIYGKVLGE